MSFKVALLFEDKGVPESFRSAMRDLGVDLSIDDCRSEDDRIAVCRDADFILTVVRMYPFSRRAIERMEKCKFLETLGVGYSPGLDLAAATEHGIGVINNAGFNRRELAEHAMALILACSRWIVGLNERVKAGACPRPAGEEALSHMGTLHNKVLGLVGFGNSGRAMVPMAKGFGMRIMAHSPHIDRQVCDQLGVEAVALDTLISEADFISIHVSLNPSTRHMFGLNEFKRMKRGAYVINVSRGEVIDEAELETALTEGYIAGAGLDVTEIEPVPIDSSLLKHSNVILTGHQAGNSPESQAALWSFPAEQIARASRGEWPAGIVNPEVRDRYLTKWGRPI